MSENLQSYQFGITAPQLALSGKADLVLFQALGNGDDFAGDETTTGLLVVGGISVLARNDATLDLADEDWFAVDADFSQGVRLVDEIGSDFVFNIHDSQGRVISNIFGGNFSSGQQIFNFPDISFISIEYLSSSDTELELKLEFIEDDYSANVETTGLAILDGDAELLENNFNGDRDWIAVDLPAGELIEISQSRNDWDVIIRLADGSIVSDGLVFGRAGFGDVDLTFFTPELSGRYFLDFNPHTNYSNEFTVQVRRSSDDHLGNQYTDSFIEIGKPVSGELDFLRDEDWFAVEISAPGIYRLELDFDRRDNGMQLQLLDSDGNALSSVGAQVEQAWDVIVTVELPGLYYAVVGGSGGDGVGTADPNSYSFQINNIQPDIGDTFESAQVIELNDDVITGSFHSPTDRDTFKFNAEAGDVITFAAVSEVDTRLSLYTEDGEVVSPSNSSDDIYIIEESSDYYFIIENSPYGFDQRLVDYTIIASLLNPDLTAPNVGEGYIGSDYADIISIGTGPVVLDAGAGDDVVNAGLGNTPSTTFTGGEGTDTLDLTVSSYQQIDFRAGSFEIGTLRNTSGEVIGRYKEVGTRDYYTQYDVADTKDWSRQVTVFDNNIDATWGRKEFIYDENGSLSREKTLLNSGELIDNFIDTAQTQSYQTREITYVSEGGDIASIETLFDSGSSNTVTYDVNNEFTFWDVQSETADAGEIFVWSSVTSDYVDIAGSLVRTRLIIERDDSYTSDETFVLFGQNAGTSIRTLTDTAETEAWDNWVFEYDVSRQVTESTRTNDNGIVNTLTYDRDGLFDWAQRSLSEDTADIFHWTTSERFYDAAGQSMSLEILYDEGFTVLNEFDLGGAYDWGRKVTRTEADGDITEYYYDDDGALYDTVYI